ncbi:MAG TPA: arginase [Candidatus Saccharimonadales bacterium]|nr:arginase [Candidatus Saccharimonadales bacterium]
MQDNTEKNITLLGAPLDLGAENLGVDIGPDAFRQKKIIEKLQGVDLTVNDIGNIDCIDRAQLQIGDPKVPYLDEILRVNQEIAKHVEKCLQAQERVVILGGDHSINLGAMAGASAAAQGNIGLIYLDAHGDMNVPETSLSHNIHGMHLAAVMGFGNEAMVNLHRPGAKLAKDNLLHIGGSDFDQAELELIKRENLRCFTMLDLLSDGLAPLFKMIDELSQRLDHIWVSLDLDVIDSVYAPGVGIPNHGGLTYREVATICEYIGKHSKVIGIDVVEYNPLRDSEGITAELGIELAARLLGTNYSWYSNYMDRQKQKDS